MKYVLISISSLTGCVSICLTALFAASVSGFSVFEEHSIYGLLTDPMFIISLTLGVTLDTCKYLFWVYRRAGKGYLIQAVMLMMYSWAASAFFFLKVDSVNDDQAWKKSDVFRASLKRENGLNNHILLMEKIINKRSDSRYHEQWERSQKELNSVSQMKEQLAKLLKKRKEDKNQFKSGNVALKYLIVISGVFLGLLMELSGLAAVSLGVTVENDNSKDIRNKVSVEEYSSSMLILERRITAGEVPPVIRRIVKLKPGLNIVEIKRVLKKLHKSGVIVKAKRGSFKLTPRSK